MLQRILSSHKEIKSTSESWLLLPFIYSIRDNGVLAEYSHAGSCKAINDFISSMQGGKKAYKASMREFVLSLYAKQCRNNERYFLDKTPRYYYIIEDIAELFPDAKFVFLFRNPVQIFASVLNTWGQGCFRKIIGSYNDLYYGPELLTQGYQLLRDKSYRIQYEDLLNLPEEQLRDLTDYLEINYEDNMTKNFKNICFEGRMGDSTGVDTYQSLDMNPLGKWKSVFNTVTRKRFLKNYINGFDNTVLELQGYLKQEVLKNIDELRAILGNPPLEMLDIRLGHMLWRSKINLFLGKRTRERIRNKYLT